MIDPAMNIVIAEATAGESTRKVSLLLYLLCSAMCLCQMNIFGEYNLLIAKSVRTTTHTYQSHLPPPIIASVKFRPQLLRIFIIFMII